MESFIQFIERKNKEFEKGNLISMKDIGRKGKHFFKREAWTFMPQNNLDKKVFVFERLRPIRTDGESAYMKSVSNDFEYRIGYYIVGRIGNRKDQWTWGQFCPMIPGKDFNKLMEKAKKEGVILNNA